MYSRYDSRPERPIHLPENYSGTAFSDRPPIPPHQPQSRQLEIAKPSPHRELDPNVAIPPPRSVPIPPPKETPPPKEEIRKEHEEKKDENEKEEKEHRSSAPSALPLPVQGLFGHLGNAFPFSHGLDFEELLILGLILLLSRNENDSDLVLWLILLLFCG